MRGGMRWWQLLRTRGCGWGRAGRAVLADGWRMRGADTRTGSGGGRRRRVCGCAAWMARVRGLRLARGCREIGLVWVEGCGFVGMTAVVGRGMAATGKGGSAAAWAERCGWIGCGLGFGCVWLVGRGVRVLAAGWGLYVGDSACGAGAPACCGRWIVACVVCSSYAGPLRLRVLLGDVSGPGLSFEGRGGCEAGYAVAAVEDARVRVGQCGAGGVG